MEIFSGMNQASLKCAGTACSLARSYGKVLVTDDDLDCHRRLGDILTVAQLSVEAEAEADRYPVMTSWLCNLASVCGITLHSD